jgi:endoglucanase Acf2
MRSSLLALTLCLLGCAGTASAPRVPASSRVAVGPGFYSTWLAPEEKPPSTSSGKVATPKVAPGFAQLPTTNEWWSSLIWQWNDGVKDANPYSEPMFPHPLTARARASGLELGYPTKAHIEPRHYDFPHLPDLLMGVQGLRAAQTLVESYSDWTVTAGWSDSQHHASLTLGHGLPFVYATNVKGDASVELLSKAPRILHDGDNVVALCFDDRCYALFAPTGSVWKRAGNRFVAPLVGKDYFAVAALPDDEAETLATFTEHAFAFVSGGQVTYSYEPTRAVVTTRFSANVTVKEGAAKAPLLALYRHQWLNARAPFLPQSYVSPRGQMKLLAAAEFETQHSVTGILPALPTPSGIDRSRLGGLLRIAMDGDLFKPGLEGTRDSYWEGKSFGKLVDLVHIAQDLGETGLRDRLLTAMKTELEDWFDGQGPRYYYYDATWKTLIGVPTMYWSGQQLNDHHFHYGYYIHAAATIAQFDRAWAERYAPCIELLIRDAGNYDRREQRFPYFRYFDLYAGHSWASGTSFFPTGNNQESSSEDLNFAAAVALWGAVMGKDDARDAGLFLHAVGSSAIAEYWYDATGGTFPKGFSQPMVSLVWGDGGWYDTWFNYLPGFVQGIQLTPLSTGSLWLGRYPDKLEQTLRHLQTQSRGPNVVWRDLFWMLEALHDPERAAQRFDAEHSYEPEFGNSLAHTYQWIESLRALGRIAPSIGADTPFHAAFTKGGKTTHVAFSNSPRTVTFSDGTRLETKRLSHD